MRNKWGVSSTKFHPFLAAILALVLGLFFLPGASAKSDKAPEQSQEQPQEQKAEKTPDQNPDDHPSGKDRSAEPGGSGAQGKAASDPDGDANGGADKPGMAGGFDEDKDGNNGCGNDDDFEDDNNGWCGGGPKVGGEVEETGTDTETSTSAEAASVMGVSFERSAAPAVLGAAEAAAPAPVAAPAGTLAATGFGRTMTLLALFGWALVVLGMALALVDRRRVVPAPVRVRDRHS